MAGISRAAGDGPSAIRYLELAGDSATWAFANDEAVKAYQEGLAVSDELGDPDSGARLQAKLANVLWRTARRDDTRRAFTEGLRLADLLPEPDALRKAHLLTRLGRLEMTVHRYDAAGAAFDAAAALLGDQPGETDTEADQWLELMIEGRAEHRLHCGDADGGARHPGCGSSGAGGPGQRLPPVRLLHGARVRAPAAPPDAGE